MTNDELRELAAKAKEAATRSASAWSYHRSHVQDDFGWPPNSEDTDAADDAKFAAKAALYAACSPDRILALLDDNARLAALAQPQDVLRLRQRVAAALVDLDYLDGAIDDTHPEGDGCDICRAADALRAALAAEEGQ